MSRFAGVRRVLALTTASATAAASLALVVATPAQAATVTLATVQDVCAQPNQTVKLDQAISDPAAEVTIGCAATIDLNGFDLGVRNVVINTGQSLAVTDTSAGAPGTLTADASGTGSLGVAGRAGIYTSGAVFTTHGSARVVAAGGVWAAGIR